MSQEYFHQLNTPEGKLEIHGYFRKLINFLVVSFRLLHPGKIFVSYHSTLFSDHFPMTVLVCQVPDYLERFTLLPLDRENLSLSTYLYLTQGAPAEIIMGYGSDLQEKHAGFLVHCLSRCGNVNHLDKNAFWRKAVLLHLLLLCCFWTQWRKLFWKTRFERQKSVKVPPYPS